MSNDTTMTKTLDRKTRKNKLDWYDNLWQQKKTIKSVIEETGWEVNQLELSELSRHIESPDDGFLMASLCLSAKNGKSAFSRTCHEFTRYLIKKNILSVSFADKYCYDDIHLLEDSVYTPGLSIISMNLESNRGLSVDDSLENILETKMPASFELLFALIIFPRLADAIRNDDVSPFNLSGCQFGDGKIKPRKSVIIGPVDDQPELVMRPGHTFYRNDNWTSPTFWEL